MKLKKTFGMLALCVAALGLSLLAGRLAPAWGLSRSHICPLAVPGAQISVTNIESGVDIRITAQDALTVKKLQALAARFVQAPGAGSESPQAVYSCAMGDYEGPLTKDGRCPKCGMMLQKK